jgi:cytoskeletal protein RodZ
LAADGREERAAAFGRWLLRERELRGLPREEVARLTKLAPGVIEALESGDAARMPPRAYLVGYLRTYAAAAGLDADEVVLRWQEADGGEEAAAPPRRRAAPRSLLLALAALAAALLGLWLWSRGGKPIPVPDRPRPAERAR